ncbi:MAG: hypothetical protein PHT07_15070 [Paludibacter sp.]|nr:hypothetical protein [Paludibacter sp.]
MSKNQEKKSGGAKKCGRSKRATDSATSLFARNKISYEQYAKEKGLKIKSK